MSGLSRVIAPPAPDPQPALLPAADRASLLYASSAAAMGPQAQLWPSQAPPGLIGAGMAAQALPSLFGDAPARPQLPPAPAAAGGIAGTNFGQAFSNADAAKRTAEEAVRAYGDAWSKAYADEAARAADRATLAPPQCKVLPPLLVTYTGRESKFVPVEVMANAAMRVVRDGPFDLVLNFAAPSGAVTVTVCKVRETRMRAVEMAITALYDTTDPETFSELVDFSAGYERARARLLMHIARNIV